MQTILVHKSKQTTTLSGLHLMTRQLEHRLFIVDINRVYMIKTMF